MVGLMKKQMVGFASLRSALPTLHFNFNKDYIKLMAIKRIDIQNFKSFRHQTIELGQFNVLIGANASGKSNFLQIFQFISDIAHHGLSNAISMQGGIEYLRNTNLAGQKDFALKNRAGFNTRNGL